MKMRKFGKSVSKYFRAILPQTFEKKGKGYYKYGWNDNLPLELIQVINNSGIAKKAAKKYAEYLEADGFTDELAAKIKINQYQTADKFLSKLALSFAYFDAAVLHVSRKADGTIAELKVMPIHKFRKRLDGDWQYNPTIGEEKYEDNKWVIYQRFQGTVASQTALQENITTYEKRGEIAYLFDGNPFDSDQYAIPDYLAAIEDIKTSAEITKMDYEAVLNGFNLGGIMSFVGVDETTKGEDGLTDRERIEDAMMHFTGLKKNNDGLTSRFGVWANFVSQPEQAPVFTGLDPKPILEASNTKRDIIERAVCKLWDVHPVLLGYSEASVLGNDKAIAQAMEILKNSVKPTQRMISEFMKVCYPQYEWTISEVKTTYIEPVLFDVMTQDEKRNLISLAPVEQQVPSEGQKLLDTLNSLSPLLATKVIDMIPQDVLLSALGIKSNTNEEQPPSVG
jgi:hypothetical protein